MVKKVEMFTTDAGKSFLSEETAYHQEAVDKLLAVMPQLTMIRTALEGSIGQIAVAMIPLAGYLTKTTPEAIGENHPELVPGDSYLGKIFSPSDKARWSSCNGIRHDTEGPIAKIERIWLDGKPCNPRTGDPCPYNHPHGTTCPNCHDWTYSTQEAADIVEVAGSAGYTTERPDHHEKPDLALDIHRG